MKKLFVLIVLFLTVGFFAACGEKTPEVVDVQGITISSENNVRSIKVGETLQLSATVFPENANQNVDWASSEDAVATVNESGLVTAVAKGNVDIIAVSKENQVVQQVFALIIEAAEVKEVEPQSVTISAENDVTTCKVGETIRLTATVLPVEANQSVSWSSSDLETATVNRGIVTPLKEGSVVITCSVKGYETITTTITLTFEKSDDPTVTKDWTAMGYTAHDVYTSCEDGTPIKVKGVVTHVTPAKDGSVNYYIQNGVDGFYVYKQNSLSFPVEEGKVYEVGGFKKYYLGLNDIVDVEYFKAVDETITYTINKIDEFDVTSLDGMAKYQASVVTGKAIFESASVNDSKAYNFYATVNGKSATFRVDPASVSAEVFAAINNTVKSAVKGMEFDFTGMMSAYGYGTPKTQIQIVSPKAINFGELSDEDLLKACGDSLTVASSIAFSVNEIALPKSLEGFDGVTIAWESDNELIDVATGVVKHGSENITVKLTATFTINSAVLTKEYEVVVFAVDNATYEVLAQFDCEDALPANQHGNSESKSSYAEAVVELGTPKAPWLLRNTLIACIANDVYDGTLGLRAQAGKTKEETARIEIQKDGEYNVVEFAAAVYGNDAKGIKITLEYSTDGGKAWTQVEEVIAVDAKELTTYRIKLPEGVKRVALVVVENSGRRVNIDNIKLMK